MCKDAMGTLRGPEAPVPAKARAACAASSSCSRREVSWSARSSARCILAICASATSARLPASACEGARAHALAPRSGDDQMAVKQDQHEMSCGA